MPPKTNMKIRPVRVELITCGPYDWHTYYEGKRRFSRLSERARSERD